MPKKDFPADSDSLQQFEQVRETEALLDDESDVAADSNTVVVDGDLLKALNKLKSAKVD